MWGQLDTSISVMKDTVTKVQGYEDAPEPVETFEEKKPKPAPRKLSKEEKE